MRASQCKKFGKFQFDEIGKGVRILGGVLRGKSEHELTRETEQIDRLFLSKLPAEDEDHISLETIICLVGGTFSSN